MVVERKRRSTPPNQIRSCREAQIQKLKEAELEDIVRISRAGEHAKSLVVGSDAVY